jgi:hypothetical protein
MSWEAQTKRHFGSASNLFVLSCWFQTIVNGKGQIAAFSYKHAVNAEKAEEGKEEPGNIVIDLAFVESDVGIPVHSRNEKEIYYLVSRNSKICWKIIEKVGPGSGSWDSLFTAAFPKSTHNFLTKVGHGLGKNKQNKKGPRGNFL